MSANPYAGALGGREARQMLAETPDRWRSYLGGRSAEEMERPLAPGKWSLREVLCHLADCELAFGFRMRQVHAEAPSIEPFDQDAYARAYAAYTAELALSTFLALRAWNLAFVQNLTEEHMQRASVHPEHGQTQLRDVIEMLAGHDLHHLENLERARA